MKISQISNTDNNTIKRTRKPKFSEIIQKTVPFEPKIYLMCNKNYKVYNKP